jgi:hypothetical protein
VWLSETELGDRPDKNDFCKGRKTDNKTLYTVFFTRFIPAVVGPELFRRRLQANNDVISPDELCSISDEAFALLLLENSYDRWQDIYEQTGGIPTQRRGDRTKQLDSNIAPVYTHGGIRYAEKQTQGKGWTNEGIARYNELFGKVSRDRMKRPKFMVRYKAAQQLATGTKKKKLEQENITAVHSMWDDDKPAPVPIVKVDEDANSSDDSVGSSDNDNE